MLEELFTGIMMRYLTILLLSTLAGAIFSKSIGKGLHKVAMRPYIWLAVIFIAGYPFGFSLLNMGFAATLGFFTHDILIVGYRQFIKNIGEKKFMEKTW